jgi:hypothetical protein
MPGHRNAVDDLQASQIEFNRSIRMCHLCCARDGTPNSRVLASSP